MGDNGLLQPSPRLAFCRHGCLDPIENALDAFFVDGEQQRLLAGDVKIDRARRHGGCRREVAHAGRVIAALGELGCGGVEEGRPPIGLTLRAGRRHRLDFHAGSPIDRLARIGRREKPSSGRKRRYCSPGWSARSAGG
jgi:hypothetical protein